MGILDKRGGLTTAQKAANDKAYEQCDFTIQGRYNKGDFVSDYFGEECWRIMTYGIKYHELSTRIYGVARVAGLKGWTQCVQLRQAIKRVLSQGTQDIGSRAGTAETQAARPTGEQIVSWTDRRHNSQATCPTLTVYAGGIVGVWAPGYDDSPTVAWIKDDKLASAMQKVIEQCPQPVTLPAVTVKERVVKLEIDELQPQFAAYMAARGAKLEPAHELFDGLLKLPAQLTLPRSEYRRIKAELDESLEVKK